jgi:hypothetical protein
VRYGEMDQPARSELKDLASQVFQLRYRTTRDVNGIAGFQIWSFTVIDDLRPKRERDT